jgi:hypothetical protein
LKEEVT